MAERPAQATLLTRRRIFILPTREGVTIGAVILVMLLGSANYDNGLGYLLSFLLASLALVSMVHAYRNLAGLRIRCGDALPVHAGGHARFPIALDNRGGRARHSLVIRAGGDDHEMPTVEHADVAAGGLERRLLAVAAPARGWLGIPPVTIATRYPLGLFRAWSVIEGDARCLVWPRAAGRRPPPVGEAEDGRDGMVRGGGREDFAGLRDYRHGDSLNRIHWKRAATSEALPVKVFSGSGPGVLRLAWEATAGTDLESRLSQLCRWVLDADRSGTRYALALPGVEIECSLGDAHRRACLRALALHGVGG